MTRIEACSSGAGPPLKRLRLSRNRHVCSKRATLESLNLHNTLDQVHHPSLADETRCRASLVDTEGAGTGRLVAEGVGEADDGNPEDSAVGGPAEVVGSQREGPCETETAESIQPTVVDLNVMVHEDETQIRVEAQGTEFPAQGSLVPCSDRPEDADETSASLRDVTSVEADPSYPHPVITDEVGHQALGEEYQSAAQSSYGMGCSSHTVQGINGNSHEFLTSTEDDTVLRTSETLEATESGLPDEPLPLYSGPMVGSSQLQVDSSGRALTSAEENLHTDDDVAANTLQTVNSSEANEGDSNISDHVITENQAAVGLDSSHGELTFEGGLVYGFNQQMVGSPGEIMESTGTDLTGGDVVDILTRTVRIVQAIETYSRSPNHRTREEHVDPGVSTRSTGFPTEAERMSRVPDQLTAENIALESTREVTAEDVRNIFQHAGAVVQAASNWLGLSERARRRTVENININANWESLLQENVPREASVAHALDEPAGLGDDPTDDHKRPDEAADQSGLQTQEATATDGLACPICMEPWTNTGEHRICSLACGHLFGKSCIKRWIKQSGRRLGKCPHCNKRAKVEDLRNIYVPHIAVSDGQGYEMAQEVSRLKSENEELKWMNAELQMEMDRLRRSQATATAPGAGVLQKVDVNRSDELAARKRQSSLQTFFGRNDRRRSSVRNFEEHWLDGGLSKGHTSGHRSSSSLASIGNRGLGENFTLQDEVHLLGAKVFDMDAYSQMVLVSNKAANNGSNFGLTRISLRNLSEVQYLSLPPGLGAIRDVRFSPSGKLALVASLGKRLSLFSFESNNIVINYPLQSAPWSCAWDPSVPNQVYAGLQNGSLLIFDLRQTASPIASVSGSTTRPVHTLQTVQSQTKKGILSASSSGAYFWDMGATAALAEIQRPQSITDDYREKLCVSLAYAPCLKTAVASFRPSPLAQSEASTSAAALTQADNISQPSGVMRGSLEPTSSTQENPSHCVFSSRFEDSGSESTAEGKVSRRAWRWEGGKTMVGHKSTSVMPRSSIIVEPTSDIGLRASFACGDEGTNALWLWDMNTLNVTQILVPHQSPVLDVKYVNIGERILMGCISEKTFQLYRRPHSTA